MINNLQVGQLVIYAPEDEKGKPIKYEVGCIRKLNKSRTAAFVHFKMGTSAAVCPLRDLHKIENEDYIVSNIGFTYNQKEVKR